MDTLSVIRSSKLIAISRGFYGSELTDASLALYGAGVRAFEVTFEKDKPSSVTADAIAMLIDKLPSDCVVGAGTVLEPEQVRFARAAGAGFIISPNVSGSVISVTKALGMVSIPGAMTPTEIVKAYELGADIVKLFPAGILGIDYFKAVKAPLAHIPIAAVAGITPDNISEFHNAGAVAFGISSGLYIKDAVNAGDTARIAQAAARFYEKL